MAKKSAMSKGYRKTAKKKPFLSKNEIIALIVIVVAIVLGVVLFNIFYDDGFMGKKDIQQGDIVTYATADLRDRFYKVGTIGELEGFTLNERMETATPIEAYIFSPEDEANTVTNVSVSGSFVNAELLVSSTMSYMSDIEADFSEIQETTIQGHDAYVFSYSYSEYDVNNDEAAEEAAEATETTEEPAPNKFNQNLTAYIEVDDAHTLCLHIYLSGADESFILADDQIVDYVQQYATAFTLPTEEAA